ncbi:MAG: hypothetical protein IPM48_14270 [Saprospiraceae bacterium]|nr:hypothetical protein [Saprospiraceae bacterium]
MENKKSFIYNLLISIGVIIFVHITVGNPILDFLYEFAAVEVDGKVLEPGYKYTYTVDNITYIKGTPDYSDVDFEQKETIDVVVEYIYFIPSLSKLKEIEYSSRSSYFIRSLFLKTLFYIFLIVYFVKVLKKDLLLIKNDSKVLQPTEEDKFNDVFNDDDNTIIDFSRFNLRKHFVSSILDIIIGISAFSLTLLLSNIFKGNWVGIVILLFLSIIIGLHSFTQRIVDNNIAIIINVVCGLITINGGINFDEFNNFHWNPYILTSYVVIKFTVLRFILEFLLIKWGFEVEYKLYYLFIDKNHN